MLAQMLASSPSGWRGAKLTPGAPMMEKPSRTSCKRCWKHNGLRLRRKRAAKKPMPRLGCTKRRHEPSAMTRETGSTPRCKLSCLSFCRGMLSCRQEGAALGWFGGIWWRNGGEMERRRGCLRVWEIKERAEGEWGFWSGFGFIWVGVGGV